MTARSRPHSAAPGTAPDLIAPPTLSAPVCRDPHGDAAIVAVPLGGKLARGRVTYVSAAKYDQVMAHRWHVLERRQPNGTIKGPYAQASIRVDGRKTTILMHQLIMGCRYVDHRDGDPLNNTDPNLRKATDGENNRNRQKQAGAWSSGFKGVSWNRNARKWQAYIYADRRRYHLGYFADEVKAALAYDTAAMRLHGAFARLNFPPPALGGP